MAFRQSPASNPSTGEQAEDQQDYKNSDEETEEKLRDFSGHSGDAHKSQQPCDQRDHEEYCSPF